MAGSKGGRGGQGSTTALSRQYQNTSGSRGIGYSYDQGDLQGVWEPGYDNNGNPQVIKWQGQEGDKAAKFLAKVHNEINPQDYNEGYSIYNGDYQRFSIALGMNDKPTVVSDSQFDALVKQNNLQVLYRGESGASACERFLNANTSHTGVGTYGDGYYFSNDKSVANDYASDKGGASGMVLRMALAPTARCITWSELRQKMAQDPSANLRNGLSKAGSNSGGGYSNDGEAQYALKLGYNVVTCGPGYYYALTRDAFIVSKTYKHRF